MRKNDDLAAWRVFFRIVELGSFSRAAHDFNVEPSSISRRLAALERQLGTQLLMRTNRALALTETGAHAYEKMRALIEDIDAVTASLSEHDQSLKGLVRVSAPKAEGEHLVTRWVTDFQKQHPGVTVDLVLSDQVVDLLVDRVDLALRMGPLRDEGVIARTLGEVSMMLCASPAYIAQHGAPKSPKALDKHRFLAYGGQASGAPLSLGLHTSPPHVSTLNINSTLALYRAVHEGVGICFLPDWLCADDVRRGTLQCLLPGYQSNTTTAYLVRMPSRFIPARVSAIIDWFALQWATDNSSNQ